MGFRFLTGQLSSKISHPRHGWWDLDGDITTCVGAWQPKGAASYRDSLFDLSRSNNLEEGVAPDWDAVNGWIFNGVDTYLITDIIPDGGDYSFIVRFSNVANDGRLFGAAEVIGANVGIRPDDGSGNVQYVNGSDANVASPALTSGVLAIAGQHCRRNGVADGTLDAWSDGTLTESLHIGRRNTTLAFYIAAYIQGIAFYNSDIGTTDIDLVYSELAAI